LRNYGGMGRQGTGGKPGRPRKQRTQLSAERTPHLIDAANVTDITPPGLQAEGRQVYREAVALVVGAGATDVLTLQRVADLAHFADRAATARRQVHRYGLTITGSRGTRVANPAAQIERDGASRREVPRRAIVEAVEARGGTIAGDVDAYLAHRVRALSGSLPTGTALPAVRPGIPAILTIGTKTLTLCLAQERRADPRPTRRLLPLPRQMASHPSPPPRSQRMPNRR
jgi:hypothetical protein